MWGVFITCNISISKIGISELICRNTNAHPCYKTAPDAAAADINAFINAETRGKIPKLIEPSFVKDAKMVLTNAVYFKGFWKYPFKPQRTHKDKFFVTPEESVQVDMMTQTGRFKYVDSEKLRAQVLEMPYRGDAVSMVVLLPRSGRAKEVDRLVRRLRPRRLVSVVKAMPSVPLIVKFPKISVESTLGNELISMKCRLSRSLCDVYQRESQPPLSSR
nr:serine protease inhibitor 3/4-like [Penaeus vannamei]